MEGNMLIHYTHCVNSGALIRALKITMTLKRDERSATVIERCRGRKTLLPPGQGRERKKERELHSCGGGQSESWKQLFGLYREPTKL